MALSAWWNTQSHPFDRPTLIPVSSEARTVPARSLALIRLVWVAKGARLASRILTSAPSADVEPEQVTQHAAQSCQRDALDRTQIEHEGAQVRPERRSRFQPDRRCGLETFRAARADPAMQRHPHHVRPARRDLDAVIALADTLRGTGEVGPAAPTRRCEHVALRGGVGMKRPMRAGMRVGLRLRGG